MVPNGGNYDGCVGALSAIEVVQTLKENNIATEHPLEVIIFSNEEGGVIGSRAMVGQLSENVLKAVSHSGLTVEEGIKVIGGNMKNANPRMPGDLAAFLELHIEQGGSLDREKIQIGVVEGIVGFRVWDIIIEGFANHAGTTPMNLRNDALLVAAEVILMVNREVRGMEGQQVGTIGQINAEPGAPNVIPGKVTLSLEMRDISEEKLKELITLIEANTTEIAKRTGSTITIRDRDFFATPALMDARIKDQIIKSADLLGLSYKKMPSGAGHDAQEMAKIAPVGMIFIPSVNGISHSPKEFTKGIDIANGANILLNTILELDKKL
jgi:N-carbamoyl-L-amino-acid hydrolase